MRRLAAPQREPRFEDAQRPLVPAAALRARVAVRLVRLLQAAADGVVLATNQVNLRQRIEDGAGRLAHELHAGCARRARGAAPLRRA